MTDWQGIAAAIEQRRRLLGMTQDEAAAAGGISRGTIAGLENGRATADPTRKTIAGIARAFGWPLDWLDQIRENGYVPDVEAVGTPEKAIMADKRLSPRDREIVLRMYRGLLDR